MNCPISCAIKTAFTDKRLPGRQLCRRWQAGPGRTASFQNVERAKKNLWSNGESPARGTDAQQFGSVRNSALCSRRKPKWFGERELKTWATWSWMPPSAIMRSVCRAICRASTPSEVERFTDQKDMRNIRLTGRRRDERKLGQTQGGDRWAFGGRAYPVWGTWEHP